MSYPRHNGLFVRVITSSSSVTNKSLDVLHANFTLLIFIFKFYFIRNSYALLHTPTYETADPYPLWIPLITVMLLPIMTLKIRSTKPRMKVRKIVKYQGNLPDCCNRKKGKDSPMKRKLRWKASVMKRTGRK